MRLLLDTSNVTYTVTRAAEPKNDQNGHQKQDRKTQLLLWIVQVMALDSTGGEMLNVTLAGEKPSVDVGQMVTPVELEALPWATNGKNGVAYRAVQLAPVTQAARKAA